MLPLRIKTPPSCNCLLSFAPVCEGTVLLPGKAENSLILKAVPTKTVQTELLGSAVYIVINLEMYFL